MKKEIKGKQNKNNKILSNLTIQLLISLFLFLFIIFPSFTAPIDDNSLSQLEQYLENSSYSDFQKRMVAKSAAEAIEKGVSTEDTLSIIKGSIKNNTDPYNVKKFLDTVIFAKSEGISEKPFINKVKEGLAKNVEEQVIVKVLSQKVEDMKNAQILLAENQFENGEINEMIEIVADSLANGVPKNALTQVFKISSEQGKSWLEVEEVTKELANLSLKALELGIGSAQLETIFNQALNSGNNTEDICMNIQDLIAAQIAVQVTSGSTSKDVTMGGVVNPDVPASPSGSVIPGSGSTTPSEETGSSPFSPDGEDKTDSESGTSPFK